MDSYRRVNATSVRNMGLLTWCLLQDKCLEQNIDLFSTYVDLTKAFDTTNRDGFGELWQNIAALKNSSPSLDNLMMAYMQVCKPFLSQIGLSRDVSWLQLFSASCFLQCCLILLVESTFNSTLTSLSTLAKTKIKTDIINEKLLYSKLSQGERSQGNQKKCFKDILKVSMKSFGITPNCLEYLVQDRDKWHKVVKWGVEVYEARRNAATELHRKLKKGTATSGTCSHHSLFSLHKTSTQRLVSLAIHALKDPVLIHKVNQMILID